MAWEKILGEPHIWKNKDLELLECLFSDRSELAYFHFSELHKACLGLSGKPLEEVLSFTARSAIDAVDNTGRTTLSWAAQRGDYKALELLLRRGANANRPDNSLRTPVHWSVAAENDDCMLLLLQYDALVDARDDSGRTALSLVASRKQDVAFMETMVRFHADIEGEDDEGWRPLHWAAHKDQPATLNYLLDHGANHGAIDNRGRNPLHVAILRNCHRAIQALVDKSACGEPGRTALGSTILHSAADVADMKTLHILQSANLGNIDILSENNDGFTAQKIAGGRRDGNEKCANSSCQAPDPDPLGWYQAFEAFMDHFVRNRVQEQGASRYSREDTHHTTRAAESNTSSDWETVEELDGHEVWEDAMEITDGSCSPDAVAWV